MNKYFLLSVINAYAFQITKWWATKISMAKRFVRCDKAQCWSTIDDEFSECMAKVNAMPCSWSSRCCCRRRRCRLHQSSLSSWPCGGRARHRAPPTRTQRSSSQPYCAISNTHINRQLGCQTKSVPIYHQPALKTFWMIYCWTAWFEGESNENPCH